jgi:hypothetical protein
MQHSMEPSDTSRPFNVGISQPPDTIIGQPSFCDIARHDAENHRYTLAHFSCRSRRARPSREIKTYITLVMQIDVIKSFVSKTFKFATFLALEWLAGKPCELDRNGPGDVARGMKLRGPSPQW